MGIPPTPADDLLTAARRVLRFWQATCDAHPNRTDWEDHRSFYDLAEAADRYEDQRP